MHTTEFSIESERRTVDNWPNVLFQASHLDGLIADLRRKGHHVTPFDYSLGTGPMDRFVDVPPYHQDLPENIRDWLGVAAHLKLAWDGLIVTCAGLIVRKAG